jgi:uncharacterized protein (DUF433 family)
MRAKSFKLLETKMSPEGRARSEKRAQEMLEEMGLTDLREAAITAITRDPQILGGTPVFRGTRVPVQTLFDYLEDGESVEGFLKGFPTVSRELAVAALQEAKNLLLRQF